MQEQIDIGSLLGNLLVKDSIEKTLEELVCKFIEPPSTLEELDVFIGSFTREFSTQFSKITDITDRSIDILRLEKDVHKADFYMVEGEDDYV